jgi:hypothetical protein
LSDVHLDGGSAGAVLLLAVAEEIEVDFEAVELTVVDLK